MNTDIMIKQSFQIIQTVYFGLCVANDFSGTNVRPSDKRQRSRLQRWRDNFLATVVFPLGMVGILAHLSRIISELSWSELTCTVLNG